ncbi:hypothetical protein PINS_up019195 [Pythium insidiosum]|nr:hypothetical protein PINS_up012496 [Pythium insidiosum]GLE08189.1 hypothetical protein PINS_up019195 [Pythium insidiosum]
MASYPPPSDSYAKKTDDMASVSSTPAVQGVDHNGIVVGRWKSGIFDCLESLVPNGASRSLRHVSSLFL